MTIKEICLDIPYVNTKNLSIGKETITDYNNNWRDKRRAFTLDTRCMCSMVERLIKKKCVCSFSKIIIECFDVCHTIEEKFKIYDGICYVQIYIKYNDFETADDFTKKKLAIKYIWDGVEKLSSIIDFHDNYYAFRHTIKDICDRKYLNIWKWKSIKKKNDKVSIWIEHDVKYVRIFATLEIKGDKVGGKLLKEYIPDEWIYISGLDSLYWNNEGIAVLKTKFEEIKIDFAKL